MAHYRPKAEQVTALDRLADEIAALRKQVVLLRKQLTPNDEHAALEEEIDAILTRLDGCVAVERKAMAAILKRLRNTPCIAA
jgi:Tfp pilus assembly protein PilO